jgi:mono/diheme cytochrome c family protein/thiol-disulfide isomerase/thioredoxin
MKTNETSHSRVFFGAQIVGAVLIGLVALTASAALAWTLRGWREREGPPAGSLAGPASGQVDREAVVRNAGRLAYQVHCVRCHGAEGHGDGSDAERLNPPPRDFAAGQWRLAPTDENLRQVIVAGIPGTAMPGWGDSLSRHELEGLIAHVQALARPPSSAPPGTGLERAGFVAAARPGVAPELVVRDLDGNPATLADHRGRPVLVVFWGTTCSHCLSELPAVFAVADRRRERGLSLDVLPVCVDETDPVVVRDVAGPRLANRPLYLDPNGTARLYYDVQALPTFVLIDADGRLVARAEGARDWSESGSELALDAVIRSLALSLAGPSRGNSPDAAPGDHRPR